MEIRGFRLNPRKRLFEVDLPGREGLCFPYAWARPQPTRDDPIVEALLDDEVADRGIIYVLRSGTWGRLLAADVLAYNRDPDFQRGQLLYALSLRAQRAFETSGLGVREVARRLGTSPAQVYRLLDQNNGRKSVDQLVRLLTVLGHEVAVHVRPSRDFDGARSEDHG